MVDPSKILFSLPTLENQWPQTDDAIPAKPDDLVLHEDDWRQFEAISTQWAEAMNAELDDIRRIYREESQPSGEFRIFKKCHVRKRIPSPLAQSLSWSELLRACNVSEKDTHGVTLQGARGVIPGSYSFRVGDLSIYGVREGDVVYLLCFEARRPAGISDETSATFAAFLAHQKLILVHWPSPTVLQGDDVLKFLRQRSSEATAR